MLNPPPASEDGTDVSGEVVDPWAFWGGAGIRPTPTATAIENMVTMITSTVPSLYGAIPTQGAHHMDLGGSLASSDDDVNVPDWTDDTITFDDTIRIGGLANEWLAFMLMMIGWLLVFASCMNYFRALRYARAIRQGGAEGAAVQQAVAAMVSAA